MRKAKLAMHREGGLPALSKMWLASEFWRHALLWSDDGRGNEDLVICLVYSPFSLAMMATKSRGMEV